MRPDQAVKSFCTDFCNQVWPVSADVAAVVVITHRALLVTVVLVKPQFRVASRSTVMACVILPLVITTATDARIISVTLPDKPVKGRLRFADEVADRFYVELPDF